MNQKISYRACLSGSVVVNLQRKQESESLFFLCFFFPISVVGSRGGSLTDSILPLIIKGDINTVQAFNHRSMQALNKSSVLSSL
jgi:hypothetical protein